jgi:hypothetical protein
MPLKYLNDLFGLGGFQRKCHFDIFNERFMIM